MTKEESSTAAAAAAATDEAEMEAASSNNVAAGQLNSGTSVSSLRRALFAAVEGGTDTSTTDVFSTRPLVSLFFRSQLTECTSASDSFDADNAQDGDDENDADDPFPQDEEGEPLSDRDRQSLLEEAISSHKFHKGHARRLFAGLANILRSVVENEEYVPASAYENDDDEEEEEQMEGGDEEDKAEDNEEDGAASTAASRRTSFGSSIIAGGSGTVAANGIEPDAESTEALLFMRSSCLLVQAYLTGLVERRSSSANSSIDREYGIIDEAFQVAELLHDALFSLQSCGPVAVKVQAAVSSMCEAWWNAAFEGREQLVTMLVPLLVAKTLDGNAQKSDVKRLFQMRDALDLLDFADPSIDYLRSLLLRTASSPLYLRMVEGRRLVAHIFQLDVELVPDLHRAIRAQIPEARKTILEAYGDIYYRAWKTAYETTSEQLGIDDDDNLQLALEEHALQDLMVASLHVQDAKLAKSVRMVLAPLHRSKKSPEVDKLLHRMYGPILWRALSAANPSVRLNAIPILTETFPLRDPDEGEDRTEAVVTKTVDVLVALLQDDIPKIRVAASNAAGRIMAAFWDVLPTADIRRLLNEIITKHCSDASSSAVRAEAVMTVSLILETEHSHAVLRGLLPSVGNLIHDKVERVRVAVVKMLIKIKSIRGLKYYHVVPVDHLLARLTAEGEVLDNPNSPVAYELTGLMLNSYFPQGNGVSGSDQIKRTLKFLSNNPDASAVFYSNIAYHLGIDSVAKLAAMLLKCLSAAIDADVKASDANASKKRKGKKRGRDAPNADEENEDSDKILNASNTRLMASIAETICCLWESIADTLAETDNEACSDFITKAFSGSVLTDALEHFESKYQEAVENEDKVQQMDCHRISAAILRCAGNLTPALVDGLSTHISTMDVTETSNVTAHMALLCVWGLSEDVAKSIGRSIKQGLLSSNDDEMLEEPRRQSNKRNSLSEKKTSDDDLPFAKMPATVAMAALAHILKGADPSCVAAREAILDAPSACTELENALDVSTNVAETMLSSEASPDKAKMTLTLAACEAYGKLAMHKEGRKEISGNDLSSEVKTLLNWVSNRIVPAAVKDLANTESNAENEDGPSPLENLDLSRISVGSNASMGLMSPKEPAKRRSNVGKTPQKQLGDSFAIDEEKIFDVGMSANIPVAVYLIKSAVVLFAEWVSMSKCGVNEVAAKTSKWARILAVENAEIDVKKELVPAFTRLSYQIARRGGGTALAEVMTSWADDLDEGSAEEARIVKMNKGLKRMNLGIDKENAVVEQ